MAVAPSPLAIMARNAASLAEPVGLSPWRLAPKTAEYVHQRGAIACPDPATGVFNIITSFTVQDGYAASIQAVLFDYNGEGQIQGSEASLFYSLRIDKRYFPDYFGKITTSLGALRVGPYPILGGLRLTAGQTIEGLVTVPDGSGVASGSPNYVFCHLIGWQWPDRIEE